jgi:hypothetical protein
VGQAIVRGLQFLGRTPGRTPWSARDALVPLFSLRTRLFASPKADQGRASQLVRMSAIGKPACKARLPSPQLRSACQFADVVPQADLHVSRTVKAAVHQFSNAITSAVSSEGIDEGAHSGAISESGGGSPDSPAVSFLR